MATTQNGNIRSATPNSRKAAAKSAESRKCPRCGRKSATRFYSDDLMYGRACRWADCGWESMTIRDEL